MKCTSKAACFFSGMLTALLMITMITPALAVGLSKNIEVYTGVSVYVDDVKLDPKDVNGNPVDVFIYNGTTYLPVRAISNSLGVPISWDGSTWSVYVGKHQSDKPSVWLANMDYFAGNEYLTTKDSDKDNLGDVHEHCITRGFSRTYALNGIYSRMTGTLYQKFDSRTDCIFSKTSGINVYGDGELIYACTFSEGDTGIKPVNFDIDLTGILELKVVFNDGGDSYGLSACLALGDVGLWT